MIKYTLIVASVVMLWGCSAEEETSFAQREYPLELSAQVEGEAAKMSKSVADIAAVGVFVSGGTTYSNAQYSGTSGTLIPTLQGYWASANDISIYAYAPYQTTAPASVSVKTDQRNIGDYTASDFLYAAPETFSFANRNNISLTFEHHLSRLRLTLIAGDGLTPSSLEDANVSITGMNSQANIDLSSGALSTPSNVLPILTNYDDGTQKYKVIVVPQIVAAGTELFEVKIGNYFFVYTLPVAQEFKSGEQYDYTLTLSKSGISVTPAEIVKWTEDVKDNNGIAN